MTEYKKEEDKKKDKTVSWGQIKDLTAIYDDYLYMARNHEQYLLITPFEELVNMQKERMYPDGYEFPWQFKELNDEEKQEFQDFSANNIQGRENRTYINLQHIKDKENSVKPPVIVMAPYTKSLVSLVMPSMIERYTISYPHDVSLGDTEFHIDGRYKAVYTGMKAKDKLIRDCLSDRDMQTEFSVMLRIGEAYRKNEYVKNGAFAQAVNEIYADELFVADENNMLEIIGSFSEKAKDICNERYSEDNYKKKRKKESGKNIYKAQEDGFMNLPRDFWDYVELRHFMRHQWEMLEELEEFMPEENSKASQKRFRRVRAYLKFADKPIYLRMRHYIDVLHQMQKVISAVNPERIIRDPKEDYDAFVKRVKEAYFKDPKKRLDVEGNYLLLSDKYLDLKEDIGRLSRHVKIVDDVSNENPNFERMFERMENYDIRSTYLQNFHMVECEAIWFCIRHGKNCNDKGQNLNVYDAWDYLKELGIMTEDEHHKWKEYTELRRKLSHFYFSESLKEQVCRREAEYSVDFQAMAKKLYHLGPRIEKKRDNVYKCINMDGRAVTLDYENHKILSVEEGVQWQPVAIDKTEELNQEQNVPAKKEESRDAPRSKVEYKTDGDKIIGVRFPYNIYVDIKNQSIHWGREIHWYTNAALFNSLNAKGGMVQTNKNLRVTKYCLEHRAQDFEYGETLSMGNEHKVVLDATGRIKEFQFQANERIVIKAGFKHDKDGQDVITFADGTEVFFAGKKVTLKHGGIELNDDNRDEFKASYNRAFTPPHKNIFPKNGR